MTTTCDTYSDMAGIDFCGFSEIAGKCCHCDGGAQECDDDELPACCNAGGASTCSTYEMLYGAMMCSGAVKNTCCHYGGGTNTCEDGVLDSDYLTCAALLDLDDDKAHCANDEVARACCHCASVVQMNPSYVQITLSMVSTAEEKEELCKETNLSPGGGTYQSFILTFVTPATLRGSASVTLSCTSRRLASHPVRSLQADFLLVSCDKLRECD